MRSLPLPGCILVLLCIAGVVEADLPEGVGSQAVLHTDSEQNVESVPLPPEPEPAEPETDRETSPSSSIDVNVSEEIIDLRYPEADGTTVTQSDDEIELLEPSWLNEFVDDHMLLHQPIDDAAGFVFRGGTDFGISTLNFHSKYFESDSPIWTDFGFGWHFLSGPRQPDVPSQVYDLSWGIHVAKSVDRDWDVHFDLAPTFSTDWDNKSGDSFRLLGGVLLSYHAAETFNTVFGFSYLDRPDLPVLPIAGIRWALTPDVYADILIPEPKIAYLLDSDENGTKWLYLKGEVGGGSWAIESEPDFDDRLGYRDFRLLLGIETASVDGSREVLEFGYIFDRQLDFDRRNLTQHLGATWSFRMGRRF